MHCPIQEPPHIGSLLMKKIGKEGFQQRSHAIPHLLLNGNVVPLKTPYPTVPRAALPDCTSNPLPFLAKPKRTSPNSTRPNRTLVPLPDPSLPHATPPSQTLPRYALLIPLP